MVFSHYDDGPGQRRQRSRSGEAERRAEELLRAILDGTAAVTGTAFFTSLVQHLARALHAGRYTWPSVSTPSGPGRARSRWGTTLAALRIHPGRHALHEGHARSDLPVRQSRAQYFPHNKFLPTMNAQSYLGIPLWNAAHDVIGHMVLVDDKPMSEDPLWVSVLQTFAARAGAELEREQANERLREALAEVERLKNQLQAENVYLQEEIRGEHNFVEMVGSSPALLTLLKLVERVAGTETTVLIQGETGRARNWSRGPSTAAVRAPAGPRDGQLRRAAAEPARERAVRSRQGRVHRRRRPPRRAGSRSPTAARCSSTRSASCRSTCRPSCCACSRSASSSRSAAARPCNVDVRDHRRHQPRPRARRSREGRFRADLYFRLNVVPLERAAAARAPRRHPAPGRPTFSQVRHASSAGASARRRARDDDRARRYAGRATCANCRT